MGAHIHQPTEPFGQAKRADTLHEYVYTLSLQGGGEDGSNVSCFGPWAIGEAEVFGRAVYSGCRVSATRHTDASRWPTTLFCVLASDRDPLVVCCYSLGHVYAVGLFMSRVDGADVARV